MSRGRGDRDRRLGVTALAAVLILQTPLVTPGTTLDDPLVSASGAPVVTEQAPPQTVPAAATPSTPAPSTPAAGTPAPGPDAVGVRPAPAAELPPVDAGIDSPVSGLTDWLGYASVDLVVLVLAALATGLALVGLRERVRVPGPSLLRAEPVGRPFPPPARTMLLAPGTESTPELFEAAAERRFALRVDILLLPVLARPTGRGAAWIECHDATDTWLWHESWLRSASTAPSAVEADGLLIGDEGGNIAAGGVVAVTGETTIGVLPVADGLILSRPAAGTSVALFKRWVRRVGIWRAEVRARPAAVVLLLHGSTSFPLAVLLPVAGGLLAVPAEVVAATLGPVAVGFLAAALRWAALDDLDRSTSLRFPAGRGVLLVLTAPLHAATVWLATVRGLLSSRPSTLAQRRLTDEAAA